MNYILDTNIIIIYSKNNQVSRKIEKEYQLFTGENNLAISIVTLAEINSLIHRVRIEGKRKGNLDQIMNNLFKIDISSTDILGKYEEIDAFSQLKHKTLKSIFKTPRNMGKNDLWIAATASALNVPLVTTDKDFNHLEGVFIDLIYIDIDKYRAPRKENK